MEVFKVVYCERVIVQNLTEEERNFLAKPGQHKLLVHSRFLIFWLGFSLILNIVGLSFRAVTTPFCLLSILCTLSIVGWFLCSCRCGKVPILNSDMRLRISGGRDFADLQLRNPKIFALLLTPLLFILTLMGCLFFGHPKVAAALALSSQWLLGLAMMGAGLFNRTEWFHSKLIVSERDLLKTETLDVDDFHDLSKVIDFHLRIGNFEEADVLSQKLLKMAARGDGPGKHAHS